MMAGSGPVDAPGAGAQAGTRGESSVSEEVQVPTSEGNVMKGPQSRVVSGATSRVVEDVTGKGADDPLTAGCAGTLNLPQPVSGHVGNTGVRLAAALDGVDTSLLVASLGSVGKTRDGELPGSTPAVFTPTHPESDRMSGTVLMAETELGG